MHGNILQCDRVSLIMSSAFIKVKQMCVLFDVGKLNVTTSPPVDKPKQQQQQQQVPDRGTLLKLMLAVISAGLIHH